MTSCGSTEVTYCVISSLNDFLVSLLVVWQPQDDASKQVHFPKCQAISLSLTYKAEIISQINKNKCSQRRVSEV